LLAAAERLGRLLVDAGYRVVCGGLGGVMAAVARGAHASARATGNDVVGLLPTLDASTANPWIDVVIPTGLSQGRNLLVVASADVVVALGGASGTLSELALAWQIGKPIVALTGHAGWAGALAGHPIDDRRADVVHGAATPEEAVDRVRTLLAARGADV
ncbi:MAG: TIGR00725 family protein, partial [Deltaproteobacteria bacterium]